MIANNGQLEPATLQTLFNQAHADYEAARDTRFNRRRRDVTTAGAGADYHLRNPYDFYKIIETARAMHRDDAVIGALTDRATDNIVQEGFSLDIKTGDKKVDDDLKARWVEEADDPEACDIAGEMAFPDFETAACMATYRDGDCLITGTEEGPFQFIEAHSIGTTRVRSPKSKVVLGVEMDRRRKRQAYFIAREPIDPNMQGGTKTERADRIPARTADIFGREHRQAFHVYRQNRVTLTRGITALAPIMGIAGMFEDLLFAKLVQAQAVSCIAFLREQVATGAAGLPSVDKSTGEYGDATTATTTNSGTRTIEGIGPGLEIVAKPGQTLRGFSPSVPNPEFFPHVRLLLQLIGINFGLPLVLVLMDGSETNFSGWRGAVNEARKGFRKQQRNLIQRFHSPAYRFKVLQWMEDDPTLRRAAGRRKVDNIYGHRWTPPSWPYIEPVKDAEGDLIRLRNMLISPRRLYMERGHDHEEIITEAIEDNAFVIRTAKTAAATINAEYPDDAPVGWRDLTNLETPTGATPAEPPPAEDDETNDGDDNAKNANED